MGNTIIGGAASGPSYGILFYSPNPDPNAKPAWDSSTVGGGGSRRSFVRRGLALAAARSACVRGPAALRFVVCPVVVHATYEGWAGIWPKYHVTNKWEGAHCA